MATATGAVKEKRSDGIQKKKCVTHEFRVSFPHVFKPHAFKGQEADAKYDLTMLFPKTTDLSAPANGQANSLKKAAFNAAREKWGDDKAKWPKGLRWPWRDGNEKSDLDGYENTIFIKATSKQPPGLVDQKLKPILNEKDFYPGCWARAEVIAFAYDAKGNRGVSFALQNIQKLRDDESFSGAKKPEDVFDQVSDGSDDEDSYDEGAGDDEDDDDALK